MYDSSKHIVPPKVKWAHWTRCTRCMANRCIDRRPESEQSTISAKQIQLPNWRTQIKRESRAETLSNSRQKCEGVVLIFSINLKEEINCSIDGFNPPPARLIKMAIGKSNAAENKWRNLRANKNKMGDTTGQTHPRGQTSWTSLLLNSHLDRPPDRPRARARLLLYYAKQAREQTRGATSKICS